MLISPLASASGQDVVQVSYSVRDHVSKTKRTMVKSLVYTHDGQLVSATPLQDTDVVGQIVSPSGTKRAVLRSTKNGNGSTSRFVEIWTDELLQTSLEVSDYHHDFYTDGEISINKYFHFLNSPARISQLSLFRPIRIGDFIYCRGDNS